MAISIGVSSLFENLLQSLRLRARILAVLSEGVGIYYYIGVKVFSCIFQASNRGAMEALCGVIHYISLLLSPSVGLMLVTQFDSNPV